MKLTSYLFYSIIAIGDKMKSKFKLFIIVLCFFIFKSNVSAVTLNDLYNDLNALEKSYNKAKESANMSQAEMNRVKANIANTEQEIKQAQADITKAENEIVRSEEEIEEKKEETNQMLLYLQVMNSTGDSMLEYVFEADNYTDFIYRYSIITQMTDYNQELMIELETLVSQLNAKKEQLAKEQKNLESKKKNLQSQYLIVQAKYEEQQEDSLDVASQISDQRKMIKKYEDMGCSRNQDINTCNGVQAVDGWTYPLKHFWQSSIYAEARGNVRHYAVDLAASEGNKIYAVANGEVISSGVYWSKYNPGYSCGGYVIQIRHNYNGSYYVSLYMHLLDAYVSVGDKVNGGQVIGTSGGGTRANAKWKDTCSGGAHLHFAMSNGRSLIGSSSTKGSTFDPVKFFPALTGYGARL